MDTKKIRDKVTVLKVKARKFYDDHYEAVNVLIGGCIGAFLFGYWSGGKMVDYYQDGYSDGYETGHHEGHDSIMDELWSETVRGGGSFSQNFANKNDGRRIRVHAELLPEKHID